MTCAPSRRAPASAPGPDARDDLPSDAEGERRIDLLARGAPASRTHDLRRGRQNQFLKLLSASLAHIFIHRHGAPPLELPPSRRRGGNSVSSSFARTLYQTVAGRSRNRRLSSVSLDGGRGRGQRLIRLERSASPQCSDDGALLRRGPRRRPAAQDFRSSSIFRRIRSTCVPAQ